MIIYQFPCEQCKSCVLFHCCSSMGSFMPFEDKCPAYIMEEEE